jgi:hypothetical protein
MLMYNVTFNLDQSIEQDWINWMKESHIPKVMATDMFVENRIYKIMHEQEDGSVNYSVQYFAESLDQVLKYQKEFSPKLQADVTERYQDKLIAFRTLLELIA